MILVVQVKAWGLLGMSHILLYWVEEDLSHCKFCFRASALKVGPRSASKAFRCHTLRSVLVSVRGQEGAGSRHRLMAVQIRRLYHDSCFVEVPPPPPPPRQMPASGSISA